MLPAPPFPPDRVLRDPSEGGGWQRPSELGVLGARDS